nr:MAG: ORF1 [TTV-like mini virus]
MPPFYRRNYYYRNYWNYRKRRNAFRRKRFRGTFRRKPRRRRRVRKRKYFKRFSKKLKKLRLSQWQPSYIRKCTVKGFLLLFEAGHGRFANNFVCYKESYTPHNQPGGGGWSIQQLNLGNLFTQNQYFMNFWSHSNNGLNLCRYLGCRIDLYRQPNIDYIFTYYTEQPQNAGKYWYPTFHPMKMLTYKNKVTVPSLKTQPLKRKIKKTLYLKPPKLLKNQWYFQTHLSNYPLLSFASTAVSLNHMFLSSSSNNANITIPTLNTAFFMKSAFQYADPKYGYIPKEGTYIYGLRNGEPELKNEYRYNVIYLGSQYNTRGIPVGQNGWGDKYTKTQWGNVFNFNYLQHINTTFITNIAPDTLLNKTNITSTLPSQGLTLKFEPYYYNERYNPYKDKGDGNMAYWLSVSDATKNNWEPPADQDLIISGFPFWLMLWGFEDYTKKCGKITNFDDNMILVLKTKYISGTHKYYVPLSQSFIDGQAPYHNDASEISPNDSTHWFPKWKFQKEVIDSLLMSGPGTCKAEGQQSIQAFMKYYFFFKWGGNSSELETISDPISQPVTPSPPGQYLQNEITNPETSIENMLYKWDIRRHTLTQAATERIKQCETYEHSLFPDGIQTSTDIPWPKKETSHQETTPQEEKQALLLQLQQLEQFNQQLQQRFLRLRQLTMET